MNLMAIIIGFATMTVAMMQGANISHEQGFMLGAIITWMGVLKD